MAAPSSATSGVRAARATQTSPFMDVMLLDAGCAGRTASQCHLRGQTSDGQLERETYAAKSIVAADPLPADAIDALVTGVASVPEGTSGSAIYDALGGAVAPVAPEGTAFSQRPALRVIQLAAGRSDPAREVAPLTLLPALHAAVRAKSGAAAY